MLGNLPRTFPPRDLAPESCSFSSPTHSPSWRQRRPPSPGWVSGTPPNPHPELTFHSVEDSAVQGLAARVAGGRPDACAAAVGQCVPGGGVGGTQGEDSATGDRGGLWGWAPLPECWTEEPEACWGQGAHPQGWVQWESRCHALWWTGTRNASHLNGADGGSSPGGGVPTPSRKCMRALPSPGPTPGHDVRKVKALKSRWLGLKEAPGAPGRLRGLPVKEGGKEPAEQHLVLHPGAQVAVHQLAARDVDAGACGPQTHSEAGPGPPAGPHPGLGPIGRGAWLLARLVALRPRPWGRQSWRLAQRLTPNNPSSLKETPGLGRGLRVLCPAPRALPKHGDGEWVTEVVLGLPLPQHGPPLGKGSAYPGLRCNQWAHIELSTPRRLGTKGCGLPVGKGDGAGPPAGRQGKGPHKALLCPGSGTRGTVPGLTVFPPQARSPGEPAAAGQRGPRPVLHGHHLQVPSQCSLTVPSHDTPGIPKGLTSIHLLKFNSRAGHPRSALL